MDPSIPNSNTSRNLDADGKPLYPSTYKFEKFIMINKRGDEQDISHLVTSFTIAEEIFSPLLTAKIVIRDNVNFFEAFGLDGQEIVKVKIEYLDSFEGQSENRTFRYKYLSYQFVVTDYAIFEKTTESINVQEYEINLVSPWAYLSRLQQISESVKGDPVDAIEEIFKTYLASPSFNYQSKERHPCIVDNLKAVITKRTPLQAVEYLRGLCYDKERSPFFIYTTLQNEEIIARSWADIIGSANKVYGSYQLKPFVEEGIGTVENLRELRSKIISLNSNIKLDKLSQAVAGGVGSVIEVVDFENRAYIEQKEYYDTKRIQQNTRVNSEDFNFRYLQYLDDLNNGGEEIINNIVNDPTASRSLRYLPNDPYPVYGPYEESSGRMKRIGGYASPARIKATFLAYAKKYFANMESAVHEIGVYGDPNLSAAKKIKIEIPKAVDTNERNPGIDNSLSGIYVISTSAHIFENGIYTNKLRIIKDTGAPDVPFFSDDVVYRSINDSTLR
jgi:hypothetical protein